MYGKDQTKSQLFKNEVSKTVRHSTVGQMFAEIINFSLFWPNLGWGRPGGGGEMKISKKKVKALDFSEKARNTKKIFAADASSAES